MKVKIKDITEEDLLRAYEIQKAKFKKWILENPGKGIKRLQERFNLTASFMDDHIICKVCGNVERKSDYAKAQLAAGNNIIFKCKCGIAIAI